MSRESWFRRGVLAAAVASLAWSVGGCRKKTGADLVIVSPHSKKIEEEFDRAFGAWHKARFGTEVKIEWRDVGGTTSATRFLLHQHGREGGGGIDCYFGGGGPDHRLLATRGATQPVPLPPEVLAQLPETIGGVRQYDPQGHWYGAAVSCFGILYNAKLLADKGLPAPRVWDDLARAEMFGRIVAADATQSGSARAAYEMIVQSAPDWPAGWAKLLRIFANCKRFTGGASDVVNDVANGDVLAGAAIDFYAYDQIALSGENLGFAVVAGTTAFTPDPISLLAGAPHAETGRRFIEFVLSPAGQLLWCLPPGGAAGPAVHALYRQPVRRDVYRDYKGRMLSPLVDPFERSGSFRLNEVVAGVRISRLHGPLMKAAALDSRAELSRAWKVILDTADAPRAKALTAELVSLPPDLAAEKTALETAEKLADPKGAEIITSRWQKFFREKYERIVAAPHN